jgi:hypothetical protein
MLELIKNSMYASRGKKRQQKKAGIKSFSDDAKIICQRDKKFLPAVKRKIFW